jgi:hypothetical protein
VARCLGAFAWYGRIATNSELRHFQRLLRNLILLSWVNLLNRRNIF